MTKQTKNQPRNVATKLIESHLVSGTMKAGEEIGLKIDQTLTQDATGTLVMLELEAMGLGQVKTPMITCACAVPARGSACGSARPGPASAIRCTWNALENRARPFLAPTAIPALPVPWECWQWGLAVWLWP